MRLNIEKRLFYTILFISIYFCLPKLAWAGQHYHNPVLTINGQSYRLVKKDNIGGGFGQFTDSAEGFCKLQGYSGSAADSFKGWIRGPYVILDSQGHVLQTFSDDSANIARFDVIVDLECAE